MKRSKVIILTLAMTWMVGLVFLACEQEFAETPQGSEVTCEQNITTVDGVQGTTRTTATVTDALGSRANGVAVTVSTFSGLFSDPVTAQALPNQFVTQTNDQGTVQIDFTCPSIALSCNGATATCTMTYDIGVDFATCALTVTAPEGGLGDCPT